jgi:hypothetical protein
LTESKKYALLSHFGNRSPPNFYSCAGSLSCLKVNQLRIQQDSPELFELITKAKKQASEAGTHFPEIYVDCKDYFALLEIEKQFILTTADRIPRLEISGLFRYLEDHTTAEQRLIIAKSELILLDVLEETAELKNLMSHANPKGICFCLNTELDLQRYSDLTIIYLFTEESLRVLSQISNEKETANFTENSISLSKPPNQESLRRSLQIIEDVQKFLQSNQDKWTLDYFGSVEKLFKTGNLEIRRSTL